jgi:glucose-6-phosphate 1-dehydrogenase
MHVPNDTPTILVVFGATGDLMERKIAPALYRLREKGQLSSRFRCVGMARRDIGDARFREDVGESVRARHGAEVGTDRLSAFLEDFSYSQGSFDDVGAYGRLLDVLNGIDDEWQVCANKLFYLAVPPEYYRTILEHLAASGLTAPCGGDGGWTRVLVEKPFGRDGATAQELDELLGTLFDESQIYRIDHYLAKEMLQGILAFRFSNNLLEPSWDARAIERIEITLTESLTAEGRGAFYDGVGALRDVGQNHLLQMLALITMARPAAYDADAIRAQRVAALKALAPLTREQVTARTFRAQYDGYRDVEGVAPGSETETFFRVETTLDSADWAGVPVVLTGGKALASPRKDIVVTFRSPDPCMCPDDSPLSNKVVFTLEPTESITITFWTKRPGLTAELEERDFDFFLYEKEEKTQYVEEYARLLSDAFAGDQTLFVSTREVRGQPRLLRPEGDGDRLGRLEGEHDLVRQPRVPRAHARVGTAEGDDDLLAGRTQRLAAGEDDGHAGPVGRVEGRLDPEEGLGAGVGRDPVDVAVAVVLRAEGARGDLFGCERRERAQRRDALGPDRVRVVGRGPRHRDERQHLQQVVLADVPQGADTVVEGAAPLGRERLRERDLYALDRARVPRRLEQVVGEAEGEDALEHLLREVVVDAVDLRLVEQRPEQFVELLRRGAVAAERLLHEHPRPPAVPSTRRGQPGGGEVLEDGAVVAGRHREVEELVRADLPLVVYRVQDVQQAAVGGHVVEAPLRVGEVLEERCQPLGADRSAVACPDGLTDILPEVGVADVAARHADTPEAPGQLTLLTQAIERGGDLALHEIARRSEHDEDRGGVVWHVHQTAPGLQGSPSMYPGRPSGRDPQPRTPTGRACPSA